MKEIKETCYKGTRILLGDGKRTLVNRMIDTVKALGFTEISIPIIQFQDVYEKKVGEHNLHLMFRFEDTKLRKLCLAPEVTAIIQQLSRTQFKYQKDIRVFYVQECFRRENPQAGRYRQFTQFGVEIINPSRTYINNVWMPLDRLAHALLRDACPDNEFTLNLEVERGLDYYKNGKGFEITCEDLGAQKQICGGGEYEGGVGFAIGIDRVLLLK